VAQCVTIAVDGHVVASAAVPCDGYVMVTSTEYGLLQAFQAPTTAQAAQFFAGGFSVIVFSYLVAWGYGCVLNMFESRSGR
jgi:hypothetical protein